MNDGLDHQEQTSDNSVILGHRVELQLFLTLKCNLACTYCSIGVGSVRNSQAEVQYSLDDLDAFIEKHLKEYEIFVTFFGGEPTLNIDFMQQVMEHYPLFRFQIQTNGLLLDKLPDVVAANLSNVLVSIDGGEKITDTYRGKGVYRRILDQLPDFRKRLGGHLTARAAWASTETTFEDLDHLAKIFDWVYFQFSEHESAYTPEDMEKKKEVLDRLVERFFSSQDLYPMIPLMGIVRNKLFPSRAKELYSGFTQCRSSTHLLNVLPDGTIFPCPDISYLPEMKMGDIKENWLRRSPLQPTPSMPCESCSAFSFCRRSCMKNLYLAYVKGDEDLRVGAVEPICDLTRHLGETIDSYDPHAWFASVPLSVRNLIRDCEVYEYVEIMP